MRDIEIGFYAHHHGHGHLQRSCAVAAQLQHQHPVTIFSSLADDCQRDGLTLCSLPLDYEAGTEAVSFKHLHYAPLNIDGLRRRAKILTTWFVEHWPCLLVVDVSVEVATLARLCGVPTVYVRQRGERFDEAHNLAYATSTRLLAPFPAEWEEPDTPQRWRDKTDYCGLISRYETLSKSPTIMGRKSVTVLTGYGGTMMTAEALISAARTTPQWHWTVVGPIERPEHDVPSNMRFIGTVDEPAQWLIHADVVVGSAGDSVVSEIAHLRQRFICLPEQRPFNEQQSTAEVLRRLDLAIVLPEFPAASRWPALLQSALEQATSRWNLWQSGGSVKAAEIISHVANEVFAREGQSWTF